MLTLLRDEVRRVKEEEEERRVKAEKRKRAPNTEGS